MNDIAKTNIKERLVKAIESENLLSQDVAAIFGMHPSYISWFKNPKYWDRIGDTFWEKVMAWANSGQKLREYSEKRGKVLPDKKHIELPLKASEVAKVEIDTLRKNLSNHNPDTKKEEIVPEEVKIVLKPEKVATKSAVFEEDTAVSQAQIGWILNYSKEGKSAEQISRKLKIYLPIVQQIITGVVVPLHESQSVLDKGFVSAEDQKTPQPRLSNGQMVDFLLEEKRELAAKIDAIDTLLKHYIS